MRQFDERFITSGKRFLALAIAVIIEAVAVLHAAFARFVGFLQNGRNPAVVAKLVEKIAADVIKNINPAEVNRFERANACPQNVPAY